MDCRILRQITLKADGHLACDDSAGYGIDLGLVRAGGKWKLRDILEGPIYSHVRSSFQQGRTPWPTVCEGCDLLALGAAPNDILSLCAISARPDRRGCRNKTGGVLLVGTMPRD